VYAAKAGSHLFVKTLCQIRQGFFFYSLPSNPPDIAALRDQTARGVKIADEEFPSGRVRAHSSKGYQHISLNLVRHTPIIPSGPDGTPRKNGAEESSPSSPLSVRGI